MLRPLLALTSDFMSLILCLIICDVVLRMASPSWVVIKQRNWEEVLSIGPHIKNVLKEKAVVVMTVISRSQ